MESDPAKAYTQVLLPRHPDDPVPRLRRDLVIAPNAYGPVMFEATVPGSEDVLGLYEFEVSVTRMLDGHRTAAELLQGADHIGIPLSFDSLGSFLRRLNDYGFLSPAGAAEDADPGPWPPRVQWPPPVRAHYQAALRAFREDRLEQARAELVALLELQPELPEPVALLARLNERIAGRDDVPADVGTAAGGIAGVELLSGPGDGGGAADVGAAPRPSMTGESVAAARAMVAEAERLSGAAALGSKAWAEGPRLHTSPSIDAALEAADVTAMPRGQERCRPDRRRRWPAFAAGTGIAMLLGVLGVPLPYTVRAPVELRPQAARAVVLPEDARLVEWLVAEGAWVEQGRVVARLAPAALLEQKAQAEAELAALETKRQAAAARAFTPAAKKAKTALGRAEATLARTRGTRPRQRQSAVVERLRSAWREAAGAAELEAVEARQEEVAQALAEVEARLEESVAQAAIAGRFEPADVTPGESVRAGSPIARIVDGRRLRGRIPLSAAQAARVTQGLPLTLSLAMPHPRPQPEFLPPLTTHVAALIVDADGRTFAEVEVEVDAHADGIGAMAATPAQAEIHCARSPLLSHLLGPLGL